MQKGIEVEDRDYFQDRFTADELRALTGMVGVSAMFARRSPSLKQLGLAGEELSDDRMLELMLEEPRLVRRPLIKMDDRLLVGGSLKAIEEALSVE